MKTFPVGLSCIKRQEVGVNRHGRSCDVRVQLKHQRNSIRPQTKEAISASRTQSRLVYGQETKITWPAVTCCLITLEVLAEQRGDKWPLAFSHMSVLWSSYWDRNCCHKGLYLRAHNFFYWFLMYVTLIVIQDLCLMKGKVFFKCLKKTTENCFLVVVVHSMNFFKPEDCTLVLHKASVICKSHWSSYRALM